MVADQPMSDAFYEKLAQIVEANLSNEQFGVDDLVKEIGLSRSQVHRKLKSISGQTISQFIREIRLQRAHELLEDQAGTTSEIAYKVGFHSPTYFNKCFHDYYGYTPGSVKINDAAAEVSGNESAGFKWKRIVYGVLFLLLCILLFGLFQDQLFQKQPPSSSLNGEITIAILPFKDLGNDTEGEIFAQGVRLEILNHLNRINDLKVKSISVVDRLYENGNNIEELVATLGLTHYLVANTDKVQDKIRISVQLTNALTKNQDWSESFDHNYRDLHATQSEIAQKVADALQIKLTPALTAKMNKKPTENSEAWYDYMKALYYFRKYRAQWDPENLSRTVMFLRSSIQKDPNFALGYASLAVAYQQESGNPEVNFVNPDSVLVLCNRAMALDPNLIEAYVARADYFVREKNNLAAETDYKKALILKPDDPYANWRLGVFYGGVDLVSGNWELALSLKHHFRAISAQPESWLMVEILAEIGWIYMEVAEYAKAEAYMNKALSYDPESLTIVAWLGQLYRVSGQYQKLYELIQKKLETPPHNDEFWDLGMYYLLIREYSQSVNSFAQHFPNSGFQCDFMYGYALLKMGDEQQAKAQFHCVIDELRDSEFDACYKNYALAKSFSALGIPDSAYHHLEIAVNANIRWGMSDFMQFDPPFENIKNQPEFQRLVAIARNKVREKREEIRKLEISGEFPSNVDELELY